MRHFFLGIKQTTGLVGHLNAWAFEELLALLIHGTCILFKVDYTGYCSYHVYNIIFVKVGNIVK